MNRTALFILIFLLGVLAAWIYFQYISTPSKIITVSRRGNNDLVTLKLPTNSDPAIFGPAYWKAYHELTSMIPCSSCREKAVPFISFFHDLVNKNTGKQLYDAANFKKHVDYIKGINA